MASSTSPPVNVAQVIREISRTVPPLATQSTVAIVASKNRVLCQLGSGTLLAVADQRFLVTAGHVVREAALNKMTLGVSGSMDGQFLAMIHSWRLSPSEDDSVDSDPHDVAIYEFLQDQRTRFHDESFIRVSDVIFDFELSTSYFTLFGFPAMWSSTLTDYDQDAPFTSKLLQYSTVALQDRTYALSGYDSKVHLLLDAAPESTTDHNGQPTSLRTNSGHPAQMPQDLGGVSGCSVWLIGDLRVPIERWSTNSAKPVGVETGVYSERRTIKVTRWNAVTTLLYQAFPMLRPALELYAHR